MVSVIERINSLKMLIKRIWGGVLYLFTLVICMDGMESAFVDVKALIIANLIPLGMMLLGGCNIPLMIKSQFSNNITSEELSKAITDWGHARRYFLIGGTACALIGIAMIISSDPAKIGPGMATVLLGVLYAIIYSYGFALPCQVYLKDRAKLPLDYNETSEVVIVSTFTLSLILGMLSVLLLGFSN